MSPADHSAPQRGASAQVHAAVAARPRPLATGATVRRWRRDGFGTPLRALASVALIALLAWTMPKLWHWAVVAAVWQGDVAACDAVRGQGACWAVIGEKHRLILFGRYPYDAQWRPLLATGLLLALLIASCLRRCWTRALPLAWVIVLAVVLVLLGGGVAGLAPVPTDQWGGLPLTVLLATLGLVIAFPLAIAVALGRRSRMPLIRSLCAVYVETVRGVPLISVLFMASFLFPLFVPPGLRPDVMLRVVIALALFAAAYLAEIVRAGLQSVPRGQHEAAASLGLGSWQAQRLVVLPQALAAVVPALVNSFIGLFKDTSLITIVSLYELTGALGLALNGDPAWRPYKLEGYLFITAIYAVACIAMSRYAGWIERSLARSRAR